MPLTVRPLDPQNKQPCTRTCPWVDAHVVRAGYSLRRSFQGCEAFCRFPRKGLVGVVALNGA